MEFRTTGNIHVQITRRMNEVSDEVLFTALGEDVSVSDAFDGFFIIKVKRPPEQTVMVEATEQKS